MRAVLLVFMLLLGGIFSCNNPGASNRLTGGDALPSTILDIDLSRDTTVTTPGGAILKIPMGALDGGGATRVKLEVKEAFLLEDMIRGKLFTRSEDQLLSSGGMIYINATAGQSVTIRQPISVMIPTTSVQHGMMVYDGQTDTGGNMNWINPRPLADISANGSADNGKVIFESNCASCHGIKGELTGPPLAWIASRRDKKWLADFTRNSARMLWRGDALSCFLFNRYGKSPMPVYPNLSDADLNGLYAYISQASQGIDSNSVPDLKRAFDSCAQNDPYCNGAPARTNTEYTQPKTDAVAVSTTGGSGATGDNYYGFTIDKFGWNNIDILLKDLPGVQESDLLVRVKGVFHEKTEVFLGIPSLKVLEKGTFVADKNEYFFYTSDGKIPLPQGVAAYIVVRSENEGQPMFGKAKWIIGKQQLLSPEPKAMSQEDIAHAIHELPFDSTDMAESTAWDTTDAGAASTTGNAGTDTSAVTHNAGGASAATTTESIAAGTANVDAANAGATVVPAATGKRRARRAQHLLACPCWCDEMDYRKADSIARAATRP